MESNDHKLTFNKTKENILKIKVIVFGREKIGKTTFIQNLYKLGKFTSRKSQLSDLGKYYENILNGSCKSDNRLCFLEMNCNFDHIEKHFTTLLENYPEYLGHCYKVLCFLIDDPTLTTFNHIKNLMEFFNNLPEDFKFIQKFLIVYNNWKGLNINKISYEAIEKQSKINLILYF
jgi:uridine kinase